MKVIIHAGFHKTGTTSLQNKLRSNRSRLSPDLRVLLKDDIPGLTGAAKGFSVSRDALDLALVTFEAARLAEDLSKSDTPILISAESLSGLIPGRDGVRDYAAAPDLMRCIAHSFGEAIPSAELTFVFGTREADPWLYSCYTQHLRASRMCLSAAQYARDYAASADLDQVIARIRQAVDPHRVEVIPAEDRPGTPLGRLDMLLDLAGYPADKRTMLCTAEPANHAPNQTQIDQLLAINRSDLSDADARAARLALNKDIA